MMIKLQKQYIFTTKEAIVSPWHIVKSNEQSRGRARHLCKLTWAMECIVVNKAWHHILFEVRYVECVLRLCGAVGGIAVLYHYILGAERARGQGGLRYVVVARVLNKIR